MTEEEMKALHQKINTGVKIAITQAIERHPRLGESITIWRDGKVVILTADQIPQLSKSDEMG
jgi:hypothetical protein